MSARNSRPITFTPIGLSDAVDATNAFPGAMFLLQNLIPSSGTKGIYVPRPASLGLTGSGSSPSLWGSFVWGQAPWGGFGVASAAQINALVVVGNIAYGMVAVTSGPNAGKDQPFAYNVFTNVFQTIAIPGGAASLPATPATAGDWTPPIMNVVGSRVMISHPGYPGGATKFGWLDISGFSDAAKTGNTHTSTLIDGLSANVLQAGWQIGMTISGAGIPANTTIVSIAANGLSLVLSQAATASTNGVALTVAGGTFTAPLYGAGDTNLNNLVGVPVSIAQFNGRAYYAVPQNTSGLSVQFSDSLNPCQITNTTQALSFANGLSVTAMIGLPVSQVVGGILQALLCFQSDANIIQITGDPVTSNLAQNNLGVGVGTIAPLTLCQTTLGVGFITGDGLRIIDFLGRLSEPIGQYGEGIRSPFTNAINPTRMCGAYNDDVIRISVKNGNKSGQPIEEYWFHVGNKSWSGPHTFPAAVIQPLNGSGQEGFVLAAAGVNATLWSSTVIPRVSDTYVENNAAMQYQWQTTLLPDNQEMQENAVVESTIAFAIPSSSVFSVVALNENNIQLDAVSLFGLPPTGAIWGSFVWGQALWGATTTSIAQYDIPWHGPLVFKQMSLNIAGFSSLGTQIGNFYFRYRPLGYRMQAIGPLRSGTAGSGVERLIGNIPVSGGAR